mmetsp:Transcript_4354/g.9410  ORF Transcript_4354/g.9410 Transcript_4354/m.9410 type:complete len:97 (-) Transcript_4354:3337-3627(-)
MLLCCFIARDRPTDRGRCPRESSRRLSSEGVEALEGDDLKRLTHDAGEDARENGANRLRVRKVVAVDGDEVGVVGVESGQDLFDGPRHGRDVNAPS